MYYTGIGSRQTPTIIQNIMTEIAIKMYGNGWILRSGAADGADIAFEKGAGDQKQIFLPWPGFNNRTTAYSEVSAAALIMARAVHPAWEYLNSGVRRLHGRNAYQVFGPDLAQPTEGVICWTSDGAYTTEMCSSKTGGTSTAIKLAHNFQIPVLNLKQVEHYHIIAGWLKQEERKAPWL